MKKSYEVLKSGSIKQRNGDSWIDPKPGDIIEVNEEMGKVLVDRGLALEIPLEFEELEEGEDNG